jgi:hypothetical protein
LEFSIALQINNWNENENNSIKAREILVELKKLIYNVNRFNGRIVSFTKGVKKAKRIYLKLKDPGSHIYR